jgi:hypothetical protein
MRIKTYGRTAEKATLTFDQIRDTQRLVTKVRKNIRRLENFICTWDEAREITEQVAAHALETRIGNRAARISAAGRLRRARVALAV